MGTIYVVEKRQQGRRCWKSGQPGEDSWSPVSHLRPRTEREKAEDDMKRYKEKHGKPRGYWGKVKFRVSVYKRVDEPKPTPKKKKKRGPKRARK